MTIKELIKDLTFYANQYVDGMNMQVEVGKLGEVFRRIIVVSCIEADGEDPKVQIT